MWSGISWWSWYNPDWFSCGLWCDRSREAIGGLALIDVEELDGDHEAVGAAGQVLLRRWS